MTYAPRAHSRVKVVSTFDDTLRDNPLAAHRPAHELAGHARVQPAHLVVAEQARYLTAELMVVPAGIGDERRPLRFGLVQGSIEELAHPAQAIRWAICWTICWSILAHPIPPPSSLAAKC